MERLLRDTGIMTKILAVLGMLGVIAIAALSAKGWQARSTAESYVELLEQRAPAITQLVRSHRQITEVKLHALRAMAAPPESVSLEEALSEMERSLAETKASLDEAVRLDPGLAATVQDLRRDYGAIHNTAREAVQLKLAGDTAGAVRTLERSDERMEQLSSDLRRSNELRTAATKADAEALQKRSSSGFFLILAVGVAAILGMLWLANWIIRTSIVRPLGQLGFQMTTLAKGDFGVTVTHHDRQDEIGPMAKAVLTFRDQGLERARLEEEKTRSEEEQNKVVEALNEQLTRLAKGDLGATIHTEFPPSYEQVRKSFNSAVESLGGLIRHVTESAAEIRTGSKEIAQASEDLARRTESNAASLEETSAAIVQMDGRLKATAQSSTETVGRADQAIATVSGGRELADEAVQAMGRVSDSAKGIDSVIEGLDKIAFQTRVLAMNAAVEAGRAGEAGRGFAVVADLVSALAMRAEEEAKRARDQLTVTQTDIVTAVSAVEKVDAALQNISADVGEVHQLLGSMANDNQAQALAITEINAAIASMDQSTQQNAAMVEETSAAARNLLGEVNGLAEQAAKFRVEGGGRQSTAPHAEGTERKASLPRRGKEGGYQSPVKPLPAAALPALVRTSDDDWKEF